MVIYTKTIKGANQYMSYHGHYYKFVKIVHTDLRCSIKNRRLLSLINQERMLRCPVCKCKKSQVRRLFEFFLKIKEILMIGYQ